MNPDGNRALRDAMGELKTGIATLGEKIDDLDAALRDCDLKTSETIHDTVHLESMFIWACIAIVVLLVGAAIAMFLYWPPSIQG